MRCGVARQTPAPLLHVAALRSGRLCACSGASCLGIGETIEPAGVGELRWRPRVTAGGEGQMMRLGAAGTRAAAGGPPRPRTSPGGRGRELGAARPLPDRTRLLTLTRPGA